MAEAAVAVAEHAPAATKSGVPVFVMMPLDTVKTCCGSGLNHRKTIVEIQVGMGPAGELRYPSYPERDGTWKFPGVGAFQCHDKYMLGSLMRAAEAAGKPEWGFGGPTDAGGYNSRPDDTDFFRQEGGGWSSEYGEFFMSWYSQMLLEHGDRVLSGATSVFGHAPGVHLSVKVAGIHWHYGTESHAAELTAGYYNTRHHDGYLPIARMLGRHGAVLNFTCVEMRDHEQPQDARCMPEGLVREVAAAVRAAGVGLAGENAATVRRRGVRPGGGHGRGGEDGSVHIPPHGARPVPAGELAPVRRVREADGGRNWLHERRAPLGSR